MPKVPTLMLAFLVSASFAFPAAQASQVVSEATFPVVPQALILSPSGSHYPAITRALSTVGFLVREVSPHNLESSSRGIPSILVIPEHEGRELDAATVQAIVRDVEEGIPLLLDGPTALAAELGIKA